jgi:polar amino acid transport system substrate-binding protein
MRLVSWILLVVVALAGCEFPRDIRGTLGRVEGGTLRVGYVENEPWVFAGEDGEPTGAEAELVRGFAGELGAQIEWREATIPQLIEALEHLEIDLAIGGLYPGIPGIGAVATTDPYHSGRVIVGVPPGTPPLESVRGVDVAVEERDFAAARRVKVAGGNPVHVSSLAAVRGPLAAPDWKLEALGFHPSGIELSSYRYVMALPPGENAFLIRLERYLRHLRPEIGDLLRRHAR